MTTNAENVWGPSAEQGLPGNGRMPTNMAGGVAMTVFSGKRRSFTKAAYDRVKWMLSAASALATSSFVALLESQA